MTQTRLVYLGISLGSLLLGVAATLLFVTLSAKQTGISTEVPATTVSSFLGDDAAPSIEKVSGEEVYENEWLNFRIKLATANESYGNNKRLYVEYHPAHWVSEGEKVGFDKSDPTRSVYELQFRDDRDTPNERTRPIAVAMPADISLAPRGPGFMDLTKRFSGLSPEEMCARLADSAELKSCEVGTNPHGVKYARVTTNPVDGVSLLQGGGYLIPLSGAADQDWKLIAFYMSKDQEDIQAVVDSFEYMR